MIKKSFLLGLILIILLINLSPVSSNFSRNDFYMQKITNTNPELHEKPNIDFYKNNIHVVFATWPDEYNCEINYIKSIDNGKNWSELTNLTNNISKAMDPDIAVNKNMVHVVWKDYRNEYPEIYYKRSFDNGKTWETARRLTFDSNRISTIYNINLLSDNDYLYLVWKDYRSGSAEIFYKISKDSGNNWSKDKRLTSDYKPSYSPSLEISNSNIYIIFEEWGNKRGCICFLKSLDFGDNWLSKTYLTDNSSKGDSKHPDIFVDNKDIYVVWQDDRTNHFEIFFKKSKDYGKTWSKTIQVTSNNSSSFSPKIYSYENNVICFFSKLNEGKNNVFYKISNDYGNIWSEKKSFVKNQDCYDFDFVGKEDNIQFIWQKYHEPTWSDIFYMSNITYNNSNFSNQDINIIKTKENTPGFELIIVFLSIMIFFIILKRRYE